MITDIYIADNVNSDNEFEGNKYVICLTPWFSYFWYESLAISVKTARCH